MPDTPEALIEKLYYTPSNGFPRVAIEEIITRKDEMALHLVDILTDCANQPEGYFDDPKSMLPTYAAYLLAQFRDVRGYRPLIKLLGFDRETLDVLFGDSLTEEMHDVIASMYDGDDAPLRGLIEDGHADEYARGSAGLQAYLAILKMGKITSGEVECYFRELLEYKLERKPSFVWDNLTSLSADLGFSSLWPLIVKAFDEDLCDPLFDGMENIEVRIMSGKKKPWDRSYHPIDDVVGIMKKWLCFEQPRPEPISAPSDVSLGQINSMLDDMLYLPKPPAYHGVTRNDPCPCGSGKKFKKCCGAG